MQTIIALLRGVNVGGHARVPMADLREVATGLGLADVRTYLQSGNLLFTAGGPATSLAGELERAIAEAFGVDTTVILRSAGELAAAAAANPFPQVVAEPTKLHVAFLAGTPADERVAGLDRQRFLPDTFEIHGREVYIHYPDGAGRSKLGLNHFERGLATRATARNWKTVTNLLAMVGG